MNAPHHVHVSQEGERGVGSSKGSDEAKRVVVGILSMQIPTSCDTRQFWSTEVNQK